MHRHLLEFKSQMMSAQGSNGRSLEDTSKEPCYAKAQMVRYVAQIS